MSSSDDPFDKKLRKHFQGVFDDFEVPPSASLKERIWQRMAKPAVAHRQYGLLVFSLLLLVGTGFFYQEYYSLLRSYQMKAQQVKVTSAAPPIESNAQAEIRSLPSTHYSHRFTETDNKTSKTNSPAYERTKAGHLPGRRKVEQFVNVTSNKRNGPLLETRKDERNKVTYPRISRNRWATAEQLVTFDNKPVQFNNSAAKTITLRTETPDTQLSTPLISSDQPVELASEKIVSWQSLQPLSFHPVGGLFTKINRNVELTSPRSASLEQPVKHRTSVRWLVGVSPLSTYQLMTVVDKPDTYVQRVGTPAAFSRPTWGYQLSGGIEWRQFDFQLSFGQMRRWAYYDLATSTFQVEPIGTKKYQVTQLEQPVSENISLTMMGAEINKQYRLGGAHSRYFARTGGQISYVPAARQSLIWAKAAVGLTLPLMKIYQFQFGPTVEYGFSRIWSTERQLIIQPYLVGASITIRPTKP